MRIKEKLQKPSDLRDKLEQRVRIMHMLMRCGKMIGVGVADLSGHVVYALDGRAYVVTTSDIWEFDYFEMMSAMRSAELPLMRPEIV